MECAWCCRAYRCKAWNVRGAAVHAGAKLGMPDTGLISYGEMVEQGRYIHEATRHMPVIGDGDTGYGNAMNVKRTVRGYAAAGFAGRSLLGFWVLGY